MQGINSGEILYRKIVDHLNWANEVNRLLTDKDVHEIDVQADPHKCGFGKWYYSEDRKKAEELVPEIKPLLARSSHIITSCINQPLRLKRSMKM